MRAFYRIRQFLKSIFVTNSMVDMEFVRTHLTPAQEGLFLRMQAYDRYHSVLFAKTLIDEVYRVPDDLLVAALLHDVGKSRYKINSFTRMVAVLVNKFAPHMMEDASLDNVTFLNKSFLVAKFHAEWSEEMVNMVGVSEVTSSIIASHEETNIEESHPHYDLLKIFVKFDDLT